MELSACFGDSLLLPKPWKEAGGRASQAWGQREAATPQQLREGFASAVSGQLVENSAALVAEGRGVLASHWAHQPCGSACAPFHRHPCAVCAGLWGVLCGSSSCQQPPRVVQGGEEPQGHEWGHCGRTRPRGPVPELSLSRPWAQSLTCTLLLQGQPAMENCTDINSVLQNGILLFQLIIYIPVVSFGFVLNTVAFWVFCCKLKSWTETRVYMLNLVVTDCFLLFALPFMIYFTKNKHPIDDLCFAVQMIYFTNRPMSIYIIMLIAIDRYIAIIFPLKAKTLRSPRKSASVCGCLWIIQIIYSYYQQKFQKSKENYCIQRLSTEPKYLTLVSISFGFFIPLIIIIFCSVKVIKCLKKKMASSFHETKLIQKALHIVSVNLCVFTICFSPIYITVLLRFIAEVAKACSPLSKIRVSIQIFSCLANINCCLDAFCYYFAAKEFQEFSSLLPTFILKRSKVNQSQELQQPTEEVML